MFSTDNKLLISGWFGFRLSRNTEYHTYLIVEVTPESVDGSIFFSKTLAILYMCHTMAVSLLVSEKKTFDSVNHAILFRIYLSVRKNMENRTARTRH